MRIKYQWVTLLNYNYIFKKPSLSGGLAQKHQATTRSGAKSTASKRSWKQKFFIFAFICAFFAILNMGYWLFQTDQFPIQRVKLIGDMAHVSHQTLQSVITPHIQAGFFSVNVSKLQKELLLLPWIKRADVRRVWPGQLVVHLSEHDPKAIWNDEALMSREAILFSPPLTDIQSLHLPRLHGPEGKQMLVWEQYLSIEEKISSLHLRIVTLELAHRGAWQLQLSNGIQIKLGTQDVLVRLQRFVDAYQKALSQEPRPIAYVDLRYTNGMAVGWATNSKAANIRK